MQQFQLRPHPGDRPHNPLAALDKLPDDILLTIFDKAADGDEGVALAGRDPVALPRNIARAFRKLRLSRLLAVKSLVFWIDRIELFQGHQRDGRKLYWGGDVDRLFINMTIVNTINLTMSIDSLKTMAIIANNPLLALLIETVQVYAFDFTANLSDRNAFKEMLTSRWFPSGHLGASRRYERNKMGTDRFERLKEEEYLEYRRLLTEQQQMLTDGSFEQSVAHAFSKFSNLDTIIFERGTEWAELEPHYLNIRKYASASIRNRDIRDADLKPLEHTPVYWLGLLKLLAVASQYPKIDKLILHNVVPELSLVGPKERTAAIPFFRNVKRLDIECDRDASFTRASYSAEHRVANPRCRDAFKNGKLPEAVAWSDFMTACPHLDSFALSLKHSESKRVATTSKLVDLILKMAAPNSFRYLYLGGLDIEHETLRTFLREDGCDMTHACLDDIRLFSDVYNEFDRDAAKYPVVPEEDGLAAEILVRCRRDQSLKVAVYRIHEAEEFEQMFQDEHEFEEIQIMDFGTRKVEVIKDSEED